MEHYRRPHNKGLKQDEGFISVHLKNPSCGDDLSVQVRMEDSTLAEVRQEGSGCAICCSSASVMTDILEGEEASRAKAIIQEFKNMVSDEEFDADCLEDAIAFSGVAKLPPRIKCAVLAWLACEECLDLYEAKQDKLV